MPVDEFNQYFELDYSEEDTDSPNYKICGFCKDTGNMWYDDDFIGYPEPLKEEVDIATLVDKLIISDLECQEQIVQACNKLGITKANDVIWYTAVHEYDTEFQLQKPYKDSYNGLKYIGVFKCLRHPTQKIVCPHPKKFIRERVGVYHQVCNKYSQ